MDAVAAVAVLEDQPHAGRRQLARGFLPDEVMLPDPRGCAVVGGHLHHHVRVRALAQDLGADRRRRATPVVQPADAELDGLVLHRLAAAAGAARDLGDIAGGVEGADQIDL